MTNVLKIEYPGHLPDLLQESVEEFEREAVKAMVIKLFEAGRISSGIAADILNTDRVSFLFELGKHKVSIMNFPPDELSSDLKNA
jgi:predicted HTH domain antitoxin